MRKEMKSHSSKDVSSAEDPDANNIDLNDRSDGERLIAAGTDSPARV
jgi:hypothetical protein